MKKILCLILFLSSWTAFAQQVLRFVEPPDSTAFGKPDGKLVSKEIGIQGSPKSEVDRNTRYMRKNEVLLK